MVFEQIDISAGQILIIVDLLMKHLSQMLIRLLIFILDESLRELVHEIGGHTHDLRLIHRLLNLAVVGCGIVTDISLQVLILCFHLHIV